MNRKGFTLVELLAVIAILGILVLISLPNIVDAFNTTKKKNFVSEAQGIYKTSENNYVLDSAKGYYDIVYVYGYTHPAGVYTKELDVSSREGFKYLVKFNDDGEIYYFIVSDSDYCIELGNANDTSTVVKFKEIALAELNNSTNYTPQTPTASTSTTTTTTTTASSLSCEAGYYNLNNSCTICPENYYCTGGTSSPRACASGKTSPAGSTSSSACIISSDSSYTVVSSGCTKTASGFQVGYNYQSSGGTTLVSVMQTSSSTLSFSIHKVEKSGTRYKVNINTTAAGGAQAMNYCTFTFRINDTVTNNSDLIDVYINNSSRRLTYVTSGGYAAY